MQPQGLPPPSYAAPGSPEYRSKFGLLLVIGALVLAAIAATAGYLIGSAGIQPATLHVTVENRMTTDLTVQVLVNGKVRENVVIGAGQIVSYDERVTFAGSDGAFFEVKAVSTLGPNDADTVFVNSPGTYPVSLRLG